MRLVLLHPEVAARSCQDCAKYLYDEHGEMSQRCGVPLLRPMDSPMPCETCPKIPRGAFPSPYSAVELDHRGWEAWNHYRECKAVGEFPKDDTVRKVAAVIDDACRDAQKVDDERRHGRLMQALAMGTAVRKGIAGR